MNVIFKNATKLGNRTFAKGPQAIPDGLARNLGFKKMVASGQVSILPRTADEQKVRLSADAKNLAKAKTARKIKAHQSAAAVSSAYSKSTTVGPVQASISPAKSTAAGGAPASPATAQEE